ncbi:MAG: Maltose/maltodextrin import ATP-binding protein MalK [Pseudomonadota bacterium]|jgi:multiple sugar transport system ATP-binding protein
MSAIEFRNICKRYGSQSPLTIKEANLQVQPGEFCVFVGPSGCGKSTLLRMVAGLEDISAGELLIDGQMMNEVPPAQRGVAMVFQSYALYPHMTVEENLGFGLKTLLADKTLIAQKVAKAAEALQLTPLLQRLPKELSGGQRQRVAIGRAIVKEPKVFLFDEPLSNLDAALRVQTRLEIAKLHKSLNQGTKKTSMIYVTHDQVEAMTLADKIVLLHTGELIERHGSIAQVGTPMELYHHPKSLFVAEFIGSPKMNILPAIVHTAGAEAVVFSLAGQSFTAAVDGSHLSVGQAVNIGIRPEHIEVGAGELKSKLSHVEYLGDSSLLYVQIAPELPLLTVKARPDFVASETAVLNLSVARQHVHVFDASGLACQRR